MAGSYKYTPIGDHPRSRKTQIFACAAALITGLLVVSSWSGGQSSEILMESERQIIAPTTELEPAVAPLQAEDPAQLTAPVEDEDPTVVVAPVIGEDPAVVVAPVQDEAPTEAVVPVIDIDEDPVVAPVQDEDPAEAVVPVIDIDEDPVAAPVQDEDPAQAVVPVIDIDEDAVVAPVQDEDPAVVVVPVQEEDPAEVIVPIKDEDPAVVVVPVEQDADIIDVLDEDPAFVFESGAFELYKVSVSSRAGGSDAIRDFVDQTIAVVNSSLDLGCGGVEVSAFPFGVRLDWVESPVLANDPSPVDEWQSYFEYVNGDLSEFNAFMHNKVTMFVPDLEKPLVQLLSLNGTQLMLRRSVDYSKGEQLGHVSFEIAGRFYELVGPTADDSWPVWSDEECPAAHRLDDDLDKYSRAYDSFVENADEETKLWAAERGYYPPMVVMVGVATVASSIENLRSTLFQDLEDFGGVGAIVEEGNVDDDECRVYRLDVKSSDNSPLALRYVVNEPANLVLDHTGLNRSVADFDEYVLSTHEMITGSFDKWDGWDHWLDQHVGLKYSGDDAEAVAQSLNSRFKDRDISVAQRTLGDRELHWFAGYAGSTAWEFVVEDSISFSLNDQAGFCACVASNNDLKYYERTGLTNCSASGFDAAEDP